MQRKTVEGPHGTGGSIDDTRIVRPTSTCSSIPARGKDPTPPPPFFLSPRLPRCLHYDELPGMWDLRLSCHSGVVVIRGRSCWGKPGLFLCLAFLFSEGLFGELAFMLIGDFIIQVPYCVMIRGKDLKCDFLWIFP